MDDAREVCALGTGIDTAIRTSTRQGGTAWSLTTAGNEAVGRA